MTQDKGRGLFATQDIPRANITIQEDHDANLLVFNLTEFLSQSQGRAIIWSKVMDCHIFAAVVLCDIVSSPAWISYLHPKRVPDDMEKEFTAVRDALKLDPDTRESASSPSFNWSECSSTTLELLSQPLVRAQHLYHNHDHRKEIASRVTINTAIYFV